jgi:hypothetical protein
MKKIGLFTLGATLLAAVLLWASVSGAEETLKGTLLLKAGGGILPDKLPRAQRAPIKVLMQASISTTDKSVPPPFEFAEVPWSDTATSPRASICPARACLPQMEPFRHSMPASTAVRRSLPR